VPGQNYYTLILSNYLGEIELLGSDYSELLKLLTYRFPLI